MSDKDNQNKKIFSFKSKKTVKSRKQADTPNSSAATLPDGTFKITDNFRGGPKSFSDALNSSLMFTNPEKYISNLKKFLEFNPETAAAGESKQKKSKK